MSKSKLKENWDSLLEKYPQLRDYFNSCYVIECFECKENFRTTNIEFIFCKKCADKKSPKVSN